MGDRANIIVETAPKQRVFLYTHWRGDSVPSILQDALARKQRWTDGAYLARIIFCRMVEGEETEETGFGISTGICDNEHDYLLVNVEKQRVQLYRYDYTQYPKQPNWGRPDKSWTFDEFIMIQDISWDALGGK